MQFVKASCTPAIPFRACCIAPNVCASEQAFDQYAASFYQLTDTAALPRSSAETARPCSVSLSDVQVFFPEVPCLPIISTNGVYPTLSLKTTFRLPHDAPGVETAMATAIFPIRFLHGPILPQLDSWQSQSGRVGP